jgi:hypothetical protein
VGGVDGQDGLAVVGLGVSTVSTAGIAPGEKIMICSWAGPGQAFPVKVTDFEPAGANGTAFHAREVYAGPLLGLIRRSMPDLGPSFGRFRRGLRRRVEAGH